MTLTIDTGDGENMHVDCTVAEVNQPMTIVAPAVTD